jgi:uncharacterized protein (DUF58 family)
VAQKHYSFLMPPMEHRFIRFLYDRYQGWFTVPGRVLLWALVGSSMMLLSGLVGPLVLSFSFCLSCVAAGFLTGAVFRPRVRLERQIRAFPAAGDELSYSVAVENTGRRRILGLTVEERSLPSDLRPIGEPPRIDELAPGERRTVTLRLKCLARGAFVLGDVQASTSFPSGLVKWSTHDRRPDRLLVYPAFAHLEHLDIPRGRNYQPGGISIASQVGDSSEFLGTREWRQGDRLRDLHWPSLARTGRLISREFQQEYFVRLALVLDVKARTAREERWLERSLSLAAGIADALARQEYIIDIFAAGDRVFHFQAGRALARMDNILEILACIEPGDTLDVAALEAALLPEASRLSGVILLAMDWEPRRQALVRELEQRGVAVRVVSIRPDRPPVGLRPEQVVPLR